MAIVYYAAREGGISKNILRGMCLPDFWIFTFAILNLSLFTTHQHINFVQKTLNFAQLSAFSHHLIKIHPIYVNCALSSEMKTPSIAIPKFVKKHPKRQAHACLPWQCGYRPPIFCFKITDTASATISIKGSKHNWTHFTHRQIVYCYPEFNLCDLKNLKLFQLE